MELTVVDPADRDDEFVAHSATECGRLREGEVVRIRRHAAADEARLSQYESPVVFIAQANRFSQRTDYVAARMLFGPCRCFPVRTRARCAGHISWRPAPGRTVKRPVRRANRKKPCRE